MIKYLSEQELENIADATMRREFVCLATDDMQSLLSEVREARAKATKAQLATICNAVVPVPKREWQVIFTSAATFTGREGWEPFAVDDGKIYLRRLL